MHIHNSCDCILMTNQIYFLSLHTFDKLVLFNQLNQY